MSPNNVVLKSSDDEIDLVEIVKRLWGEKALVASVSAVCAVLFLGLGFLLTPQYEVKSYLRPVSVSELDALNSSGIYSLTPEDALNKVSEALESYELRFNFFSENKELFDGIIKGVSGTPEQIFREFSEEDISLLRPDPKKSANLTNYIGLKIKYPEGVDGVEATNGIVDYALGKVARDTVYDVREIIKNRLQIIERDIDSARAVYIASKDQEIAQLVEEDRLKRADLEDELAAIKANMKNLRLNKIRQLEEALQIASAAGVVKPLKDSYSSDAGAANMPMYLMGSEILKAELGVLKQRADDDFSEPRIAEINVELHRLENNRKVEILKNRKDEDVFISDLAELRKEEARLKRLNASLNELKLAKVDQRAESPLKPASPGKIIFLLVGGVLGWVLSVLYVIGKGIFVTPVLKGNMPS